MRFASFPLCLAGTGLVLGLASCGGGSGPMGPSVSPPAGVVLHGVVAGGAGAARTAASALAAEGTVTVVVQEAPEISTVVGPDGSFTLRGLPEGAFTLVFSRDGVELGSLVFSEVRPNQEITATVLIDDTGVHLTEEHRNGIGHGDVEIEGVVEEALLVDPAGESRFRIDGRTVVARPGETAIREGNRSRSVLAVTVGRQVHVKGIWLEPEGDVQPVLAHEIKLQGSPVEEPDPTNGPGTCMIDGGSVGRSLELEGDVASGGADGFALEVSGNRAGAPVTVDTTGARFECSPSSGPNAPTDAQCRARVGPGAKVHVSGVLDACSASDALVAADRIRVQRSGGG